MWLSKPETHHQMMRTTPARGHGGVRMPALQDLGVSIGGGCRSWHLHNRMEKRSTAMRNHRATMISACFWVRQLKIALTHVFCQPMCSWQALIMLIQVAIDLPGIEWLGIVPFGHPCREDLPQWPKWRFNSWHTWMVILFSKCMVGNHGQFTY